MLGGLWFATNRSSVRTTPEGLFVFIESGLVLSGAAGAKLIGTIRLTELVGDIRLPARLNVEAQGFRGTKFLDCAGSGAITETSSLRIDSLLCKDVDGVATDLASSGSFNFSGLFNRVNPLIALSEQVVTDDASGIVYQLGTAIDADGDGVLERLENVPVGGGDACLAMVTLELADVRFSSIRATGVVASCPPPLEGIVGTEVIGIAEIGVNLQLSTNPEMRSDPVTTAAVLLWVFDGTRMLTILSPHGMTVM